MKKSLIYAAILMMSQVASAALKTEWHGTSSPTIMSPNFIYEFGALPQEGSAFKGSGKFWSGDYWALRLGNINLRWNDPSEEGFNLRSPSRSQVLNMSQESLARLSPTEKYDIYAGRYDYPLKAEVEATVDPGAKDWEGICHGWAPAALNHKEPTPKVLVNADGVSVPFGSSDIKALLSYYYANVFKYNSHFMGERCYLGRFRRVFSTKCKEDLNPGAFHVILANKVGLRGEGFIADIDRYREVWNHPIHSYESQVVKYSRADSNSAPGTARVARVKTTIYYTDEGKNSWEPVLGTDLQVVQSMDLEYELDLDGYGRIIGGDWKSKKRLEFLWTAEKALIWVGQFDRLHELLND